MSEKYWLIYRFLVFGVGENDEKIGVADLYFVSLMDFL